MREILGMRRTNGRGGSGGAGGSGGDGTGGGAGRGSGRALRDAALGYARHCGWPVLPGVEAGPDGRCGCGKPGCVVPGAHPLDPELLAASSDRRMVGWWWTRRPAAPIILATGTDGAPCAVSLPAAAAPWAHAELANRGVRTGPVVITPSRAHWLVAPYDPAELGELLYARDLVPGSLRFHSAGGYVPLPPSPLAAGRAAWLRGPWPGRDGRIRLPRTAALLDVLVEAAIRTPGGGSRLAS
ncbi:bifunctional DNA primase/polymerase [Streptomyces harbinensis]|uniref:bifunctional DNA primase/polymerase n=1 Tax=Streptomyces harbinensis TaxID=1176198 RepID=UPI00367FAD8C